jgi:hypothetical protein
VRTEFLFSRYFTVKEILRIYQEAHLEINRKKVRLAKEMNQTFHQYTHSLDFRELTDRIFRTAVKRSYVDCITGAMSSTCWRFMTLGTKVYYM